MNYGDGSAGGASLGRGLEAKAVREDTRIQSLNRRLNEKLVAFQEQCNRLENFADRLDPQPRPSAPGGETARPPESNDLNGVDRKLERMDETIAWLCSIGARLERVA